MRLFSVGYLYSPMLSLHQFCLNKVIRKHLQDFSLRKTINSKINSIKRSDNISNGRIDEMIGFWLSGFPIIIELTKIYRFFLWKFVYFEKSVLKDSLRISHATLTAIRCPCHKVLSVESWPSNLDWRWGIKRELQERLRGSIFCSDCRMALRTDHFVD